MNELPRHISDVRHVPNLETTPESKGVDEVAKNTVDLQAQNEVVEDIGDTLPTLELISIRRRKPPIRYGNNIFDT